MTVFVLFVNVVRYSVMEIDMYSTEREALEALADLLEVRSRRILSKSDEDLRDALSIVAERDGVDWYLREMEVPAWLLQAAQGARVRG